MNILRLLGQQYVNEKHKSAYDLKWRTRELLSVLLTKGRVIRIQEAFLFLFSTRCDLS